MDDFSNQSQTFGAGGFSSGSGPGNGTSGSSSSYYGSSRPRNYYQPPHFQHQHHNYQQRYNNDRPSSSSSSSNGRNRRQGNGNGNSRGSGSGGYGNGSGSSSSYYGRNQNPRYEYEVEVVEPQMAAATQVHIPVVPRQENGTTYYYPSQSAGAISAAAAYSDTDYGEYNYNPNSNSGKDQETWDDYGSGSNNGYGYGKGQGQGRSFYQSRGHSHRDRDRGQTVPSTPLYPIGSWRNNDYQENNSSYYDPRGLNEEGQGQAESKPSRPKSKLVLKAPPPRDYEEIETPPPPRESKNQRDQLIDLLTKNNYECMVCVAKLYRRNPMWSCANCFNIFHLQCIKKWVTSSSVDGTWRCPGCQNVGDSFADTYFCFCGKTKDPSPNTEVPHTCNLICGKVKSGGPGCTHLCSLTCHPGPCPPCTDQVMRNCECGKKSAFVQCSSKTGFVCGSPCEKKLNCGFHICKEKCHVGPCEPCAEIITLDCHCKRSRKEVVCSSEYNPITRPPYSCEKICDTLLNCKNHKCTSPCHPDQCQPCPTSIDVVISCPCGQTSIAEACAAKKLPTRRTCSDPIPTCGKVCKKILTCGPQGKNHRCELLCHNSVVCPPCPKSTTVKCRCGNQELDIKCSELLGSGDFLCAKKCPKKRSCGRHKCPNVCCIDVDHICTIVCSKPLRCGDPTHRCNSLCHNGHCSPCGNVSFEELRCECGTAVIFPPVPCGTKPPPCIQPCQREHPCSHPVAHNCHSEPMCPPCIHLTEKWCHGHHELRKNILCHITNVSCGNPCGKLLPCGKHKCPKICHPGRCQRPDEPCKLACMTRRKVCGHACGSPCHEGDCPDTKCKEMTDATCMCGRRKETLICWKREMEFDRVVAAAVASGLNNLFLDEDGKDKAGGKAEPTVESLTASIRKEKSKIMVLECDKECTRIERNKKLAAALQLENPDVETRLGPPAYTDFCKKFAQKTPQFVEFVHTKLTELVMQARRGKKFNLTYSFEPCNRDKRQLIHEYSDHFGIISESFDEEPNRNVIVTASKEKSWLPSVSLIDAVFRQTTLKTDRKNVHHDLELVEPTKTQIIGPANRKLNIKSSPNMVFLNGS